MSSERDAWAVLASVASLGPAGLLTLLDRVGSARAAIEMARRDGGPVALVAAMGEGGSAGREPILTLEAAEAIREAALDEPRVLERIHGLGLRVLTVGDAAYPTRLAATEHPPPVLFIRGDPASLDAARMVAVVGTRRPTIAGRGVAARIARALTAADATVVSGLAIGIDGVAHAATIENGGRTIAVLGGGHGSIHPRAHTKLAATIVETGGAVVSEVAPDIGPKAWSFPQRNRIISGLSDATVVVEAPARSGALLTAGRALEQGRECFLVPGSIDAPQSAGCLAFLREFPGSARIVSGIPQLIEDLGLVDRRRPATRGGGVATATIQELGASLGSTAARVAEAVVDGLATVDELVAVTDLPVATILATLAVLERGGHVVGAFGRYRAAGSLAYIAPRGPRRRPRAPSASRTSLATAQAATRLPEVEVPAS